MDRAELAVDVFKRVVSHTETLLASDGIGGNLAYLMAAILKDTYVELDTTDKQDAAFLLLLRTFFPTDHAVWPFVSTLPLRDEATA